jgi:hypothetical protein
MANTNPIFELTPFCSGSTFMNVDSTNKKTIYTAGSSGGRIDGILISTDSASSVNLAFYINDGNNDLYIGNVYVPTSSGYINTAKIDGMSSLRPSSQSFIQIPNGYTLKCNAVAAVTSGSTVNVTAIGGNF